MLSEIYGLFPAKPQFGIYKWNSWYIWSKAVCGGNCRLPTVKLPKLPREVIHIVINIWPVFSHRIVAFQPSNAALKRYICAYYC